MALLRGRDTVDLRSKVLELHLLESVRTYPVSHHYGIPIKRRVLVLPPLTPTKWNPSKSGWLPASLYLKRVRIFLLRTALLGKPEIRAKVIYLERHTSRSGIIFPQRPEYFYKVGDPDPHRPDWTHWLPPREGSAPDSYRGETRNGPAWKSQKAGRYKWSPLMLWRRRAGKRMAYKAETRAFDSFRQRAEYRALERTWERKRQSSFKRRMSNSMKGLA